eukprot:740985-Prymnesium_polylepis.1
MKDVVLVDTDKYGVGVFAKRTCAKGEPVLPGPYWKMTSDAYRIVCLRGATQKLYRTRSSYGRCPGKQLYCRQC